MTKKSNSRNYKWCEVLPEGRMVGTYYDDKKNQIIMYFSRRLTPEFMGKYRSVEEFNKDLGSNFTLSKNKKSLITIIPLSSEAALALRGTLGKTLHSSRKEIRKNAMRKAEEELVARVMTYFSMLEK